MKSNRRKFIQSQLFLLFVFSLCLVYSCKNSSSNDDNSSDILFTSGGRTSEVLVVISKDLWNSELGDSIKAALQTTPPWLAVNEPEYDVTQIPYSAFGDVYQKERNILFIKKTDLTNTIIELNKNLYAKPQSFVSIKANNVTDLLTTFLKNKDKIKALFHENEIARIALSYKGLEVRTVTKRINDKFGFSLVTPKGFYIAKDNADFMWLRRVSRYVEEGIFIYTRPYSKTSNFSLDEIIAARNEITKKYIPGPVDSSYMKTSDYFPPMITPINFKNQYASEVRSFWDVKGYPMGGPFISYTFVDTLANRLITLDGYIKAPKEDKRDLILHLEAIMSSFKYSNDSIVKN